MPADGSDDPDSENRRSLLTAASMDPDDNEYSTPSEIWRPLSRAVGGFDLDAASGAESTPIAPNRYTKEDDGLSQAWFGDVFLNPPWATNGDGSAKELWLRKVINEINRDAVDRIVVILPVDTSTHWFHDYVLEANAVCFVGPGRVSFEGGDRNPSFNLLIAVYGPVTDELCDALDSLGATIRGRSIYDPNPQQTLIPDGGTTPTDGSGEDPRNEVKPVESVGQLPICPGCGLVSHITHGEVCDECFQRREAWTAGGGIRVVPEEGDIHETPRCPEFDGGTWYLWRDETATYYSTSPGNDAEFCETCRFDNLYGYGTTDE